MKIRWTKLALSDLDDAYSYILLDNSKAAREIIKKVEYLLKVLTQHPEMGRPCRITGTKELVSYLNFFCNSLSNLRT